MHQRDIVEMMSVCDCTCHGSCDVIRALQSELTMVKEELMRCCQQLALLQQKDAELSQRYELQYSYAQLSLCSNVIRDVFRGGRTGTRPP